MIDLPLLHKIKAVEARQGYRLSVVWDTGRQAVIDISDMISRGGVFAALSDKATFSAVRVGGGGRTIEWPEPADDMGYPVIEIDSTALAVKLQEQEDSGMLVIAKKIFQPPRRKSLKSGAGIKT